MDGENPSKPDIESKAERAEEEKAKDSKLNKLSNEELIELSTPESLKIVTANIENMKKLKAEQEGLIKQLNTKAEVLNKAAT
jgi:hypothetical protein